MIVFLPLVIGVLGFYQLKGAPLYRAVLARFDGLNQVLQENMAGVRVVQAFVRGDYENGASTGENTGSAAATAAQSSAAILNPALLLVVNLGLAGALWVGGDLVIDGKIELGSVFVLLNYLVAVMIPLSSSRSSCRRSRRPTRRSAAARGAGRGARRAGQAGGADACRRRSAAR